MPILDLAYLLFTAPAPPRTYTLSLHDALPISFDGATPRDIPLTLAGHIHGGQFYVPVVGWSPGRLITKNRHVELRSEEHTSELQSHHDLVCRLLLEKKKKKREIMQHATTVARR